MRSITEIINRLWIADETAITIAKIVQSYMSFIIKFLKISYNVI
jgi:hypothetical protein